MCLNGSFMLQRALHRDFYCQRNKSGTCGHMSESALELRSQPTLQAAASNSTSPMIDNMAKGGSRTGALGSLELLGNGQVPNQAGAFRRPYKIAPG